jgi:HK97 family phage portal protein
MAIWRPWFLRKSSDLEQRSISFQDVWGSGADRSPVNAAAIDVALTLAPVFAATRLIAHGIASLPLQGYRKVGEDRRPIQTPALFANPTIFGGPYEWVQRALISLLLRGNAYGFVTAVDRAGYPAQLEWLHPDDVTLKDDRTNGRPEWFYLGRPVDAWLGRDSVGELLHIPWYVLPGHVLGLSPIRAFSTTIESGIYAQRFGRDFFADGAVPAAVLETDQAVNRDQATLIKERFVQASRGRAPVVLGAGTKYRPITVPPEESQFLESIKANATIIASIYGVRPERIGGESGNSMTYANVENQAIADLHDLQPYLTKLEAPFSSLLPKPQYVRFNLDSLLRADTQTRYATHGVALDKKFKTVDEVRADEDLPPLTDEQKAEIAASQPKPKPAPAVKPASDNVIALPSAANE